MNHPSVSVLMSTHNGAVFICEQIESILSQLPANGRLIIRDDGSTDSTVEKIKFYTDSRIHLEIGVNKGFGKSFMTLMMNCPDTSDIIMLSDQDDVWLPGKIDSAIKALANPIPQARLFCTNMRLVDQDLKYLGETAPWPKAPTFENALIENIVTGCTVGFNNEALQLIKRGGIPEKIMFHDWWLYLLVSAFGCVICNSDCKILYRQHRHNVIGHGAGPINRQIKMIRFLIKTDWPQILLDQVNALWNLYGDLLSKEQILLIQKHFVQKKYTAIPRLHLLFTNDLIRQRRLHWLFFRLLMLPKLFSNRR